MKDVRLKEGLSLHKRFIIKNHCQKVVLTQEITLSLFVRVVMRKYMQSVVTDGTTLKGRGGQNLCDFRIVQRAWGITHKVAVSKGVLTPDVKRR